MVRALTFLHTCVLRIADLESQVCSDMPNEWEQNRHRYFNAIFVSQNSCLTRIKFHFMFIFLTLTSASYVHQNKLCTSLLCIKLLYLFKGSTQIHSNFDQILSLYTMNIEAHFVLQFECNLQTSYYDDWDKFCAPSYCNRAVCFIMVSWCLLDGLFLTWSHKWSYVYFTRVQSQMSTILTLIVTNHCVVLTFFQLL